MRLFYNLTRTHTNATIGGDFEDVSLTPTEIMNYLDCAVTTKVAGYDWRHQYSDYDPDAYEKFEECVEVNPLHWSKFVLEAVEFGVQH